MSDLDVQRQMRDIGGRLERIEKLSTSGIPSGATFPASVSSGFLFFRTDYNFLCVYDGAEWITVHEYPLVITYSTDLTATYSATTSAIRRGIARNSHQALLIRGEVSLLLGAGTSNATNYWTVDIVAANLSTTVWSFDTKTDSASATTLHTTTSFTQPGSATDLFRIDVTKTLSPPTISIFAAALFYRLIIT